MRNHLFLLSLLVFFATSLAAKDLTQLENQFEAKLKNLDPNLKIEKLSPTPLENIYSVDLNNGALIYMHASGEYLFAGNLLQLKGDKGIVDLTELALNEKKQNILANLDRREQIVFPAKEQTKAVIQVFTDTTCPFCSKLHQEVAELNNLGVEVRYLAFPRQGLSGKAYDDLVSVWCSSNPTAALSDIKNGKKIASKSCSNPVAKHRKLGEQLGINGTPAIFLPNGQLIPGYVSAQRLAQELGL